MALQALGKHYFEEGNFPFHICRVERNRDISHEFDLTEVEHFHDFTELVFIIKGKGIQVIEQQEYAVSAGDVFVLQGHQKHYFKDAAGIEIVNIMFALGGENGLLSPKIRNLEGYKALFILESQYRANHKFKNRLHLNRTELAGMEFILNGMLLEQEIKREAYQWVLSNRLEELVILLSRSYCSLEGTEAQSLVRLGKVLDYLETYFTEPVRMEQLADISCMSVRNFQRIFKKAVGQTPSQYILQIRLQHARKLLRESNDPITHIAQASGFADSTYFIRYFRKAFGSTPVKFRMRNRG